MASKRQLFKRLYLTVGNTASTSKKLRGTLAVLPVLPSVCKFALSFLIRNKQVLEGFCDWFVCDER